MSDQEQLDLVDVNDKVIGKHDRQWFYQSENHFYRVVNAFVINSEGKIFIPLRKKKTGRFSGLYDFSVGGHVLAGESYEEAMIRETKEELGIDIDAEHLSEILYLTYPNVLKTSSFSKLYLIHCPLTEFELEDKIEKGLWCSVEDIFRMQYSNPEMFKSDFAPLFACYVSYINYKDSGLFFRLLQNEKVMQLIETSNYILENIGYVDHAVIHVGNVISRAEYLCKEFSLSYKETDIVKSTCLLHDIGNNINRKLHELSGAMMANFYLSSMGVENEKLHAILAVIGNHDYRTGSSFNVLSAIMNLADKTDFSKARVNTKKVLNEYDRMHLSVKNNNLLVEDKQIILELCIDEDICTREQFCILSEGELGYAEQAVQKLGKEFVVRFT